MVHSALWIWNRGCLPYLCSYTKNWFEYWYDSLSFREPTLLTVCQRACFEQKLQPIQHISILTNQYISKLLTNSAPTSMSCFEPSQVWEHSSIVWLATRTIGTHHRGTVDCFEINHYVFLSTTTGASFSFCWIVFPLLRLSLDLPFPLPEESYYKLLSFCCCFVVQQQTHFLCNFMPIGRQNCKVKARQSNHGWFHYSTAIKLCKHPLIHDKLKQKLVWCLF